MIYLGQFVASSPYYGSGHFSIISGYDGDTGKYLFLNGDYASWEDLHDPLMNGHNYGDYSKLILVDPKYWTSYIILGPSLPDDIRGSVTAGMGITSQVNMSAAERYSYIAGNEIVLDSGFESSTIFSATIDPKLKAVSLP